MKKHILHPKLSFENMRDVIEFAGNEFAGKIAYSFRQSPLRKIMRFKIDMTID